MKRVEKLHEIKKIKHKNWRHPVRFELTTPGLNFIIVIIVDPQFVRKEKIPYKNFTYTTVTITKTIVIFFLRFARTVDPPLFCAFIYWNEVPNNQKNEYSVLLLLND